jgi:hypothetical protein
MLGVVPKVVLFDPAQEGILESLGLDLVGIPVPVQEEILEIQGTGLVGIPVPVPESLGIDPAGTRVPARA